ncbi:MAG: hypothetical protein LAN37_09720 [Acidobacteriia bacterium]|nr:hypothetical protein [Terriglobia bacterium]
MAKELDIEMRWTPVLAGVGEPYRFPQKTTKYLRERYQGPAVYCWRLDRPRVPSVVYVGETDCVIRRLRGVLWAGRRGETNLRLNRLFQSLLAEGADITLEVLSFEPFAVNGYEVSMERLRNPYLRKLVESIAILTEARMGSMVLNWGRELVMRQRLRLLPQVERMEPEERRRFLKFMAAEFKKAEL